MNVLRMKVTPRPYSGGVEVAFYSCPDVKHDPQKTLKHVQSVADQRGIAHDYALTTDLEYFAVRGAREWQITEPGDSDADHLFRVKLVRAGFASNTNQITSIRVADEDEHVIVAASEFETIAIHTVTGDVKVDPILRASPAHGPVN